MQSTAHQCPHYSSTDTFVEGASAWTCSACNKEVAIDRIPLQSKADSPVVVTLNSMKPALRASMDAPAGAHCPICQDAPCNTSTPCGHNFCEWLRDHLTCPLCRSAMNPAHIVTFVPNNGDASELILLNKITRTLTYGVRCRWLKDNQPCPGTFLQKYDITTGSFEPRNCPECHGATVPVPEAAKRLGIILATGRAPTLDEFGTAQSFPSEEQLIVSHSLPAGLTGYRMPNSLVLVILLIAVIFWVCYFSLPFLIAFLT